MHTQKLNLNKKSNSKYRLVNFTRKNYNYVHCLFSNDDKQCLSLQILEGLVQRR